MTNHRAEDRRDEPPIFPISVRIPTAVRLTGISRSKLYELIRDGEVETVKIGASTLVLVASLHELLARRKGRTRHPDPS